MITPIPCQLRHPSQPPVPSLYLRQSWKPSRTTPGAEFPRRNQRKSFALTWEQRWLFLKDFTCDKLILSPGSSRGAWHIRISQNQGKNKEKEEHLDRSPNPLADVDPVSPVSISPRNISASTGVPQCPCLHTLLSKSKLTYGLNNGASIERVEFNFSGGKEIIFKIPLILFDPIDLVCVLELLQIS